MVAAKSKFQFNDTWHSHLSVGCVLLNNKNEVALHYFKTSHVGDDVYLLVRETVNNDETLEAAAARGLMEEMGAKAKIIAYLDSNRVELHETLAKPPRHMRKTTIYFLARLEDQHDARRLAGDPEATSKIVWLTLDEAQKRLEDQALRLNNRPDLHEAPVIAWAKAYLSSH